MKILGALPGRAWTFEEVLRSVLRQPPAVRNPLLRTAYEHRCLTDGVLFTFLTVPERRRVEILHWDAVVADRDYLKAEPFDPRLAVPKYLGGVIREARDGGGGEKVKLVKLSRGSLFVYAEAKAFRTLNARHPGAEWRLSSGVYWKKPLVLLRADGWSSGEVLGSLAPIPLDLVREVEQAPRRMIRRRQGGLWSYEIYETSHEGKS